MKGRDYGGRSFGRAFVVRYGSFTKGVCGSGRMGGFGEGEGVGGEGDSGAEEEWSEGDSVG